MDGNIDTVWMVFELAEEKVVERSSEKKSEWGCTNNMSMNGE